MNKPITTEGYSQEVTENCERVLVTLLRRSGPYKESIYLVGGLTPRYLVTDRPPEIPAHAGTGDVDVLVAMEILAETEAYQTLEKNLKAMGFERAENDKGQKVSWQWRAQVPGESGDTGVLLEFLADDSEHSGGKVGPLPTEGNVSAINIPHSSMVFDHYETQDITAELLGDQGVATETIRYADVVSFTCLKAFAYDDRAEPKDSHDIVYCLTHAHGGLERVAGLFHEALEGNHGAVIEKALGILRSRFVDDDNAEGYLKDGPVSVARFEIFGIDDEELRERRALRQREVSSLIKEFLSII